MPVWPHGLIEFLIPPTSLPVFAIAGLAITYRWRCLGRILVTIALAGLLILSLPLTSQLLLVPLETRLPLVPPSGSQPGAIVILGGAVHDGPNGAVSLGGLTLQRLRTGARLARRVELPILVSGGPLRPGDPAIAKLMAQSLVTDFATPATWVEAKSKNTWQNARDSEKILRHHGIHSIYLVTQPWHMRRALIAFAPLRVAVTATPTPFDRRPGLGWREFVPTVVAWRMSYYALHEWAGCAYYELRLW